MRNQEMKKLLVAGLCVVILVGICGCGVIEEEQATTERTTTTEALTTAEATLLIGPADPSDLKWAKAAFRKHYMKPNVIEPIRHVIAKRIHKDMLEFEFTLYGFYGREDNWMDDHALERNMIYAIDIQERNGDFSQRLEFDGTNDRYRDNYGFLLEDFNNDGYLDIRLHAWEGGSMRNEPSMFWLWDNEKREFVGNEELGEISNEASVSVGGPRVVAYTRIMSGEYVVSYYSYDNNVFVREEEAYIYQEKEGENTYEIVEISELVNGEMKLTSRTKTKIEE